MKSIITYDDSRFVVEHESEIKVEPIEEPKREAIQLWCAEDVEPGIWLTKGKIYPVDGDLETGSITYDDGYTFSFIHYKKTHESDRHVKPLYPLISRNAEVGEWVLSESFKNPVKIVKTCDTGYPNCVMDSHGNHFAYNNGIYGSQLFRVIDGYTGPAPLRCERCGQVIQEDKKGARHERNPSRIMH